MDPSRGRGYDMERCDISGLGYTSRYDVQCIRNGEKVWHEDKNNLVVDVGYIEALGRAFAKLEQTKWYVGLVEAGYPSTSDTMSSHPGWNYFLKTASNSRPEVIFKEPVEQTIYAAWDSDGFSQVMVSQDGEINGCFLTTNEPKIGTTGLLYGIASFSEPRTVLAGDALIITITVGVKQ